MIGILPIVFVLSFISYCYYNRAFFTPDVILVFILKILCSVSFVLLYTFYYQGQGDLFLYDSTSQELFSYIESGEFSLADILFRNKGYDKLWDLQPRALLFSKIYFCFSFLGFHSVFGISIVFSIVSFVLLLEVYKYVYRHGLLETKVLSLALLLVPSVLFWTSSVTKETLCFPLFLVSLAHLYKNIKMGGVKWSSILAVSVCMFLLYFLRFFYLPFLLLFALSYYLLINYKQWYAWSSVVFLVVFYFFFQEYLIPQLQLKYFFQVLFMSYHDVFSISRSDARFTLDFPERDVFSTLKAMLSSLRFTFFFRFKNWPEILTSIENGVVMLGLFLAVIKGNKRSLVAIPFILMLVFSMVMINTSTPNFGSLSRYRVVYWYPMVVLLLISIKGFLKNRKPLII